jgi:hypothetical protein
MLPYVPDTTSWDVANEVARRRRGQIAAAAVQQPISPVFMRDVTPRLKALEPHWF